jgi:hypothetical protein
MNNLPAVVFEDDHHLQQLESGADYDEHIDGGDRLHMLLQEGAPTWRGWAGTPSHIFGNGRLADADPELEELTMDAWCAQSGLAWLIWWIKSLTRLSTRGRPRRWGLDRHRQIGAPCTTC